MSQSNINSGVPYNFAQPVPGYLAQLLASQPVAQSAPQPAPQPVPTTAIATPPPGYQPPAQIPNNGSPLQSEFYKFLTGATNGLPGNPQPPMQQAAQQPRPLTAPSTPPGGPHPDASTFAAQLQQPALAINQLPTASFNGPTLPTAPGATATGPNVATGQTANLNIDGTPNMEIPAGAPMAKTATAAKPNFGQELLSGIGRFAPAALIALASRGNTGAGAALLGGIQRGQQYQTAQRQYAQQTADAKAQQTFDNNLSTQQEDDAKNDFNQKLKDAQNDFQEKLDEATKASDDKNSEAANTRVGRARNSLMKYLGTEPDTGKQDAAIKQYNAAATDENGNRLDYVYQVGENGTKTYFDPTGQIAAKLNQTNAATQHDTAQTNLENATKAELPQKMSIAMQHLGIDASHLGLDDTKWAASHLNPKSQYFDPTAPDTKEVIALTTKAQSASNRTSSIQRDADSLYTTIQSEGKTDPHYAGDVAKLADLHGQIADGNAQVAGWNAMIKSIANANPDAGAAVTTGRSNRGGRQTARSAAFKSRQSSTASKTLDLSKFMP